MVLIDSNLLIYVSKGELELKALAKVRIGYSSITKIETLGHPELPINELVLLQQLFDEYDHLPITEPVIGQAIRLKQSRKLKLGDAIIASTALVNDLELWTNDSDFRTIPGLKVHNPLKA